MCFIEVKCCLVSRTSTEERSLSDRSLRHLFETWIITVTPLWWVALSFGESTLSWVGSLLETRESSLTHLTFLLLHHHLSLELTQIQQRLLYLDLFVLDAWQYAVGSLELLRMLGFDTDFVPLPIEDLWLLLWLSELRRVHEGFDKLVVPLRTEKLHQVWLSPTVRCVLALMHWWVVLYRILKSAIENIH